MALKYRNIPIEVDGIHFDSKKEARRYGELLWLVKAGLIRDLRDHAPFRLEVNGVHICDYRCDFVYLDVETEKTVVEDVKSEVTRKLPLYVAKKRLMKACLNIDIVEI